MSPEYPQYNAASEAIFLVNELKALLIQNQMPDQSAMQEYLRQAHSIHGRLATEAQNQDYVGIMEALIGDLYLLYDDLFGEESFTPEMQAEFAQFIQKKRVA